MSAQKPTTAEAVAYLRKWHLPKRTVPCACLACAEDAAAFAFTIEQLQRVDALEAENAALKAQHPPARDVIERYPDGSLRICRGHHQRSQDCEWEYFAPKEEAERLEAELAQLRTALEQYRDGRNWLFNVTTHTWTWQGGRRAPQGPELAQRALAGRGDGGGE